MVVFQLVAICLFGACGIAAVALVTIGVRGSFLPTPPCCARCGQRTGVAEYRQSGRCPECGADLAGKDSVRYFRRCLRPLPILLGVVAAVLSIAAPVTIAALAEPRSRTGTTPTMPLTDLVAEVRLRGPNAYPEYQEIGRRAKAGLLSAEDLRVCVDAIISGTNDQTAMWIPVESADVLAAADAAEVLRTEDVTALGNRTFNAPELQVPKTVRQGSLIRPFSSINEATGGLARQTRIVGLKADGQAMPLLDQRGQPLGATSSEFASVRFDLPPGPHRLVATLESRYSLMTSTSSLPTNPGSRFTAADTREFDVLVVAADAPPFIPLVTDAKREAEVRSACIARRVAVRVRGDGSCDVATDAELRPVYGLTLSFEIVIRLGGSEARLRGARVSSHDGGTTSSSGALLTTIPCPEELPDRVDVVFRPDPGMVETDASVESIWGGEVVVKDVLVLRIGGGQSP